VQLHYDAETEKFRSEVRAWIDANRPTLEEMRAEPATSTAHLPGWSRRWQRRLFDAGLLVPGWPPELGGRNLSPIQQLVYHEELAKTGVWRSYNPQGLDIIAPSIRDYASDFLKQKYLVRTLRAEIAW
jgi:alkylation response protein AidB-like acyl-CoA dehydrogenase